MSVESTARAVAVGLSLSRAGLGLAMVAMPRPLATMWVGLDGRRTGSEVLARATGARDVALGVGGAAALVRGRDGRAWAAAQVTADAADLVTTLLAGDRIPGRSRQGVVAMAGTAVAGYAAFLLTNRPSATEPVEPPSITPVETP